MLKILLLVPILFAGQLLPVNNRNLTRSPSTWEYVDEIEDGGIYFIRNCYSDKVIDIPNSNYSNGQDCILYSSNGYGNQRFIVKKNGYNLNDMTYTISPVEASSYTLRINGNNSSENKPLELQAKTNFVSNTEADNFVLVPGSYTNSFRILTGASDYTKYLTTENFSISDSTRIVQKSFNGTNLSLYSWYFQKTDSLGLNVANNVSLNGTNTLYFNLRVPNSGQYILETSKVLYDLDTKLQLCYSDGTLIAQDDDGGVNLFSKIIYSLDSSTDYLVKMSGYSSNDIGEVLLKLLPFKTVYINTYFGNIDTRPDSVVPNNVLSNLGYYVEHKFNIQKIDLFKNDLNGVARLNNDYYMLSSHGSENGAAIVSPNEYFYGSELPDMSNVILAVWAICHGGKSGNIAEYCVNNKNALYSLGFPGLTYPNTSKQFTDKLWTEIANGSDILSAVNSAVSYLRTCHPFYEIFGWGNDTIVYPNLYSRTGLTSFSNERSINSIQNFLDGNLLESDMEELECFIDQNQVREISYGENSIVFQTKLNRITNNYYFVDKTNNKIYKHLCANSYRSIRSFSIEREKLSLPSNIDIKLEDEFYLYVNGTERRIKRLQYSYFDGVGELLSEVFFDIENNEIFTEKEITEYFVN